MWLIAYTFLAGGSAIAGLVLTLMKIGPPKDEIGLGLLIFGGVSLIAEVFIIMAIYMREPPDEVVRITVETPK
jgi:hypothetical protein